MRGVKRCQESMGRMKKHRYSNEFKVTAVKMATAPDIETKAVAEAVTSHPFMRSRWKKAYREGQVKDQASGTDGRGGAQGRSTAQPRTGSGAHALYPRLQPPPPALWH